MSVGRYQAYPEYKTTGAPWIETAPEYWEVFDGKRIFESCREPAFPTDEQLAASQKFGVVPQSLMMELNDAKVMLALKGTSSFRRVEKNDYVISLRSFEGGIEHSAYTGCVSPAYTVLRPIKPIAAGFYKHLFKSRPYISALQATTDSLRDGKSINYEQFGAIALLLPPLLEQTQIAAFLDHETAKIDRLIEQQQELIRLLKEKRQAVISHAVTKGLNPQAPLKDSGIGWLGQVPAHWVILALGKITLDRCDGPFGSGLKSEHYTESGVRVIRLQNIKMGSYYEGDGAFIDKNYYARNLSNHDVIAGDLLIAGLGDPNNPVGRACVAPDDIAPAMVKADCFRFRLDARKAVPGFIAQQLSNSATVDAGELSNGSTRARIPLSLMASRTVILCPLDEQRTILDYIERVSTKYDHLESMAKVAVILLQERRTALISAAVTGKIDVRNAPIADARQAH